jgi:hypothetical protein
LDILRKYKDYLLNIHPLPDPRRSGAGFPPKGKEQKVIFSPLGEIRKGVNTIGKEINWNVIIGIILRIKFS